MFEGGKSLSSIVAGIIILFLGLVPLLNDLGIIGFSIPKIPKIVLQIILTVAGFYLIIDGFFELGMHPGLAWISILFGAACTTAGVLATLSDFNSFSMSLAFMTSTVINILFILIGFLLFIGAFMF